ncbi:hypothetical protein ACI65C_007758 [Semiaphis heraclei]
MICTTAMKRDISLNPTGHEEIKLQNSAIPLLEYAHDKVLMAESQDGVKRLCERLNDAAKKSTFFRCIPKPTLLDANLPIKSSSHLKWTEKLEKFEKSEQKVGCFASI